MEIALLSDLEEVGEREMKGEPTNRIPLDEVGEAGVILLPGGYSYLRENICLPVQVRLVAISKSALNA
jgi:hypothetical protein